MKICPDELRQLLEKIKGNIIGSHLMHPVMFSSSVIYYSISRNNDEKLLFILENSNPRIDTLPLDSKLSSFQSNFFSLLKKEFGNVLISDIYQVNEDNIVCFVGSYTNAFYKTQERNLYLELIPSCINLIVTDEKDTILFSYKESPLLSHRPILKGIKYEPIKKTNFEKRSKVLQVDKYKQDNLEFINSELEKRKKEKYKDTFDYLNRKIKSLKKKSIFIEEDIKKANDSLIYKDYGNYILANIEKIKDNAKTFDYYGVDVSLDEKLSSTKNANRFFKLYKKAKSTIEKASLQLKKVASELKDLESAFDSFSSLNEEAIEELVVSLKMNSKNLSKDEQSEKALKEMVKKTTPFEIVDGDLTMLFGKNAWQNDFVSFAIKTNKEFYWFHVKNNSGSHLLLCKIDPNDSDLRLASEITLLASGLNDGEVAFTKKKNVRKGNKLGLAILLEYQSVYISKISTKANELFLSAKRKI